MAIGFTAERLRPIDELGIADAMEQLNPVAFDDDDCDQVRWLESVQNAQDNGHPWCEAIEVADQEEPL